MKKSGGKLRLLWGALGLLGLVGAYFLFQDKIVDANLRPLVERELAKAVHSPVTIKTIRGSLTGHIVLNKVDLTIPGEPWKSHLVVDQISINLDLVGLIFRHKPLEDCFKKVEFISPQITLIHSEDAAEPDKSAPAAGGIAINKIPLPIIPAGKLSIQKGVFSIQANKTARRVLRDINFDASTNDGMVWGVSLQASSPEANSQGELVFNGSFNETNLKVFGKMSLSQWPLASGSSTLKDLSGWELLDGTVDVESPFVFQPGRVWFDAATTLSNVSIKSPAPLGVVFSQINGRAFIRPSDLNIPGQLIFQVGHTPWNVTGLVPFDGRPMAIRTSTNQLQLADVFQSLIKLPDLKVDGTGTASFAATGPLSDPSLEGTAEIGTSHIGQLQLDSFSVKAGYEKGVFNLFDVVGKLYAGQFQANGFISLSGEASAPITLNAVLSDLDAKKLAASFGVNGMEGQGNFDIHLGGTVGEPILSADSQVTLDRTLQDQMVHYFVKTNILLEDQKLKFYGIFNDKTRLDGELLEKGDEWVVHKLSLKTGKKVTKLTGRGAWPKTDTKSIDLEIKGQNVVLEDLPFLQDQFRDVKGKVDIDLSLSGTRKETQASLQITSDEIILGNLDPEPMDVSLSWKQNVLTFDKLEVGDILTVTGKLGFADDSPMDLKIKAKGVPIETISEISGWANPPQPFEGWITGDLHIAGIKSNPIVEGSGTVDSLKVGPWNADQVDGFLSLDQGKLQIKRLKLSQGVNSFSVTGSYDTQAKPGPIRLKLIADNFQLANIAALNGEFSFEGEVTDIWKNMSGTLSSQDFSLGDGKKTAYHFTNFSTNATFSNQLLQGKVSLGKSVYGSTTVDFSGPKPEILATLKVGPVLLSDAPNLTQFLPSMRVNGLVSGEIHLKKGPMEDLPMQGTFTVTNGSIQKYDFDRMELSFTGNKHKIAPKFSLAKGDAKYTLAGTLSSPSAFWTPNSAVSVNGPVKNEKFSNLLSLFGIQPEKHNAAGTVNGNLTVTGTLSHAAVGFSLEGQNLRMDDNVIPSAQLNFTEANGKITFGNNQINLEKGQININQGTVGLDESDPTLVVMDVLGLANNVQIPPFFNISSQFHLSGKLALEEKPTRPGFDGIFSLSDVPKATDKDAKKTKAFDVGIVIDKKVITFKPMENDRPQLVGALDLSEAQKVSFKDIHLINSKGTFSVAGILDLNGQSKIESDAKDVPIEEVGKWLVKDFPLSGNGNYHLILEGGLDNPVFTGSLVISNGHAGDLNFDLLNAELKARDNVLYLGSKEVPIELSKSGVFDFKVEGKMPFALTKDSWEAVHNNEMDINATMAKGDFGVMMLAGFAKKASGTMDMEAHVTGTLDNPVLNMDLDLLKCQFVPPMICQSVTDLNGHIKVRDNKLAIYGLNALIGKGRIFLSSPPVEVSKMNLVNFIPQYLDLNLQSIGDHGVWISVPTIMKKGRWGEVFFYGASPDLPLRIQGDIAEPHVIGTAKMESGHYTFPPEEEKDESGKSISFPALGRVYFELNLLAGSNCWYSNESYTQYLDVRVNPGDTIKLTGKDQDRTEEHPGIYSSGQAGTQQGSLRYLGHEFKVDEASLYIPHGHLPVILGRATDTLQNVEIVTAGGVRTTNMDISINFKGSFGNIDFTLDSSPHFTTNDPDLQQKLLLSYIMFGRDMTGYTSQQLQAVYQQNTGSVVPDALLQTIDRVASSRLSDMINGPVQEATGLDVKLKTDIFSNSGANGQATPGSSVIAEPYGNTVSGNAVNLVKAEISRSLDPRLTAKFDTGVQKNLSTGAAQGQFEGGLEYELRKNLKLDIMTGGNDNGQNETKVGIGYTAPLPDMMHADKDDKQTPKFLRFDILEIGFGKYQLNWQTDLVTKGEVKVLNQNKDVIQDIHEKGQHAYDHQLVIDKLKPEESFDVQIDAVYLNGNEAVSVKNIAPQVQPQ